MTGMRLTNGRRVEKAPSASSPPENRNVETFHVLPRHAGLRLDRCLAAISEERKFPVSRTEWQRRIGEGHVMVAGRVGVASERVKIDELVAVRLPDRAVMKPVLPEEISLDVRYEDEHLAVVVKPAGMLVHPSYGKPTGTLLNALLARWPGRRPFTVHRLDRDVSGLMLVARNRETARALSEAIAAKAVERRYRALVAGVVKKSPLTIAGMLRPEIRARGVKKRTVMVASRDDGYLSKTHVAVIERREDSTLVEVVLSTGRQNQIRAHLASIGHPIVGDELYEGPHSDRLHLTAVYLKFKHPALERWMEFDLNAPEPELRRR